VENTDWALIDGFIVLYLKIIEEIPISTDGEGEHK
jgi:hypothetical protein